MFGHTKPNNVKIVVPREIVDDLIRISSYIRSNESSDMSTVKEMARLILAIFNASR
jgi:hypothetical protein